MVKSFLIAAGLVTITTLAHAGDPTGVWQSEKDKDGDWIDLLIQPCGEKFCGTVAEVYGGNPKTVGIQILDGLTKVSENRWSEGRIFAVDEDKWYDSKMELISSDQLKISGCIGYGLLCESQTLKRVK